MAKISIILPVYNTAKYLEACLHSLLNQTFEDIEIIAVNDGSTDDSSKLLESFAKEDHRIKVINQQNKGISAVRNLGIELACGTYLAFIDSDDTISPDMMESLYHKAEAEALDIVVCDYTERYEATGVQQLIKLPDFSPCSLKERPDLLFDINSSPWNKLYRKALFQAHHISFPLNLKYEDAYTIPVCLVKAAKIGKVNKPLVQYWIHSGSESTVIDKRVFDIFAILTMLKETLSEDEKYDTIAPYLEYFIINRITVYLLQQKYQKDKTVKRAFLDQGYEFLDKYDPNWRKHPLYLEANSLGKRLIKGNKKLMKWYVGG